MGGIGKTTLAKSVCKYPGLKNHFDIVAWVTVSQVFTAPTIIRPLLSDIIGDKVSDVKDEELGETLHKCLFSRKYLIILDDIWDIKAWDAINRFLPENNNGSRILLTTRLFNVARSVGSCDSYEMKLLDNDKSWNLLSKKVFGQQVCPPELEQCGKRIAESCKGLPLALVVIGGLLKMSYITLEYWEDVARNIRSIISGGDDECCLEILSLSYHQLPIHLKPCFLYMATYPEDHQISVSDVIMLWAAYGFLKPNADELPEEIIAKKYLNDLIDRNLITVSELDDYGRMKSLRMHDLVRELSIREAQKVRFENQRCLVSDGENVPEDIVQLATVRFIRQDTYYFPSWLFSSSISLLWNLETLIVRFRGILGTLPCDIWKLQHIKHIVYPFFAFVLPDPPTSEFVLEKLETLYEVQDLSDKVLNSIPNIKHLVIDDRRSANNVPFPSMVQCHKLERLEIYKHYCPSNLKTQIFPDSIRELEIGYCHYPWESMTHIGSLPNLEILTITTKGFKGKEWTTSEGEFQSLKYLSIIQCGLVKWRTEECSHFPSLEHLNLQHMYKLEEIPEVFGESMTLKSIKVYHFPDRIVRSAKRIVEEQQSNGNHEFTLEVLQRD